MYSNDDDIYVAGAWRPAHSSTRTVIVNPTTEQPFAAVPDGDATDIDRAVGAARDALDGWRATSPADRAALILRLAEKVESHASELAQIITTENGTPVSESAVAGPHAAAHLRIIAGLVDTLEREDIRPNPLSAGRSIVLRGSVGVAGLITPWNFPLSLIIVKLGPALLAGCTIVIKPAPETPMAARRLMDLVHEVGFPPGVVNLVTGGTVAGLALVEHPGVDKISFTGSTPVGRLIGEICGRMLRPVTLELGGKSPALVLDDVVPSVLVANILKVSMRNTGQTCKAATRLLVPASRHSELVELVADVIASAPLGDPFLPETYFGPLVSARQRERVLGYLDLGAAEGASAVVGGGVPRQFDTGYFVEPTVFQGVTPDMRIAREEIFGPVLAVLPYGDIDEGVRLANDSPYGLGGAVFGEDVERALAVAARIDSGNIGINHYGSNAAAPFSGHKDSGLGVEFGPEGLAGYLTYTSLHLPA